MSARQDRQGVRSPADLERKYNFERSFAEVMGVATDARQYAEEARSVATDIIEMSDGLVFKVQALDEAINGKDGIQAQLAMKVETDADGVLKGKLHVQGNEFTVETDNFKLDEEGNVNINGSLATTNGYYETNIDSGRITVTSPYTVSGEGNWQTYELLRFKTFNDLTYALCITGFITDDLSEWCMTGLSIKKIT